MAARAIWKGELKLGTNKIPVKLYSAVTDRTVHFHILDDKHLMRVKQHMVSPDSGDEIADRRKFKKATRSSRAGLSSSPTRSWKHLQPEAFARH